jgi:hypothetical protein
VIHTEYPTRTTEPCLYLIRDEECAMLPSHSSDSWPVVIGWDDCTCLSLDRLDDDTCDTDSELLAGLELCLHRICIAILDEVDRSAVHLSDWITIERLAHHGERSHRLAVERIHRRDKSGLLRVHLGELDRSLVGLRTTRTEERILQISWRDLGDETSEDSSEWIDELL